MTMNIDSSFDFNDFYYFYLVVKYGGFSAASEATLINKSKLSRHIVDLEKKFDVQLIQRTTRYFKVTQVGQELYEECYKIINQVQAAENILKRQTTEPEGIIRLASVPFALQPQLQQLLNRFLKQYPKIKIECEITQRQIDVMHDHFDIVIGNRFPLFHHKELIIHNLCKVQHCLTAHPDLIQDQMIKHPLDLHQLSCISLGLPNTQHIWQLTHLDTHESFEFPIRPRIITNDFSSAYDAVKDGLGVANLPYMMVEEDLKHGRLVQLLPHWHSNEHLLQLTYLERKGCRLVVEKLVQALLNNFQEVPLTLDYAI